MCTPDTRKDVLVEGELDDSFDVIKEKIDQATPDQHLLFPRNMRLIVGTPTGGVKAMEGGQLIRDYFKDLDGNEGVLGIVLNSYLDPDMLRRECECQDLPPHTLPPDPEPLPGSRSLKWECGSCS